MRVVLTLVLVSVLLACASEPYAPVLDGHTTARIRFVTQHPTSVYGTSVTDVLHYPNSCTPNPRGFIPPRPQIITFLNYVPNPNLAYEPPKVAATGSRGMPGLTPAKHSLFAELMIPAGQPFAFSMSTSQRVDIRTRASCTVAVEFMPQSGVDYEAVYSKVDDAHCALAVVRLEASVNSILKVPVPAKKLPTCS